jgi:rhodanese-related sulfurtransferase
MFYHIKKGVEKMKVLRFHLMGIFLLIVGICVAGPGLATEPVPINANAAFDAYAKQTDPQMGMAMKVALVDVRSRAEYFWVGTATKVDKILLKNGSKIVPDLGKVRLNRRGNFLAYKLNGRKESVQVEEVESIKHSPIAINIPFKLWDENDAKLVENPNFATEIANLVQDGIEVVILYCRNGGRSTDCASPPNLKIFNQFKAVYEIDDPARDQGFGGFEGNSYSDVYNGYRGFPGRQTRVQTVPSVSWKDAGLPMKTSINPIKPLQ